MDKEIVSIESYFPSLIINKLANTLKAHGKNGGVSADVILRNSGFKS